MVFRLILLSAVGLLWAPSGTAAQEADTVHAPAGETPGAAPAPADIDTLEAAAADTVGEGPAGPRVSFEVHVENPGGKESVLGTVVIELNQTEAPQHTANFLKLAAEGFYEDLAFHRIVPAFIIQGGDPKSSINWQSPDLGTGGPGYTVPGEFGLKHVRGAVSAARLPDQVNKTRESSGSQFFICLSSLPALDDGGYSVFGTVVDGMDTVDAVSQVRNAGARNQNRALSRVYMKNVHVVDQP